MCQIAVGFCTAMWQDSVWQVCIRFCCCFAFFDPCRLSLRACRASTVDSLSTSIWVWTTLVLMKTVLQTSCLQIGITLGGTKTWQGGLNAKEPVCLNAFALHLNAFNSLCIHVCCSQSLSLVCRCYAISDSTSSSRTTQTTARQTMHVSAPVSNSIQYI